MKNYIIERCQSIVNKEFSSNIERRLIIHEDRINFRCPYCREGSVKSKKRANIYLNKFFFICFRCGHKTNFDKLCKDFNEQLDPDKKLEMIEHLNSVMTYSDYEANMSDAKFENLIELSELERVFSSNLTQISDFKPIVTNGGIYKYLIGRGIPEEYHKNIYQAKFWKNEDESEWIIVMLNRRDTKVLGMQVRNLKEGKKRMFKIYNYENLLEWINIGKEDPIEIDMNEMVIYNKLSYYFNILNVDLGSTITVFEGYLDSLFYPNSIGLVGVNTDYKLIENNGLDIQYFFDNDDAGFDKSEEKIKHEYPVFLWKKLFEDIVEKKKVADPAALLHRISKVKDINKLCQLVPDAYSKLELWDYFSNDILDIKWIPKTTRKRKSKEETDYNKKFDSFKYL
jgi:hypothetical protein